MALGELVVGAYEEAERDRRRTDRSMALMIEELGEVHQAACRCDRFSFPKELRNFDAEDRYVMWNQRYAEIYAGDALVVGARFEDVLRAGLVDNQYTTQWDARKEWIAERLARHRADSNTPRTTSLRRRWIRVEERRTATGGSVGFVSTSPN